ncbi:NPCBM/NEW2 domain-containing protein [Actinosynnema pretiosum subsp. pretiosum]|uniref:NPCBM/NEW2 domain-containing protein n=1 Tax=Actinosynnema pretiosum subsp. pretiosum TaxID=103721 RepID=A0AA45LCI0_9PSEU|nr:hypothetical protein APASM_1042 [Actinosynnema pretiosum subsp. pretiosum]QUF07242.1 NPCBM/NEW2 domain-containing protein [Actinosynnema pretiosum subsp. pretiosum]
MPDTQGGNPPPLAKKALLASLGTLVALLITWSGVEDWRFFEDSEPQGRQTFTTTTAFTAPHFTDTPGTTTAVTTTTSATPTTSAQSPTTSRPTTTTAQAEGDEVAGSAGPTRYHLADLDYVAVEIEGRSGRCTGGCTSFKGGSTKIGPTAYPQSFITRMDGNGNRSTSTWNALRSCDSFEAHLGLTNDSGSTSATFTVSKDGGAAEVLATVATGDVAPIAISMSGVNRFVLAAHVSGDKTDRAVAVWGEAVLTCAPGSLS